MNTARSTPARRRLKRIGVGLYSYAHKDGTQRFAALVKHRKKYNYKFGFPTVSKARQWRISRKGAIADGRLFPEQIQQQEADTQKYGIRLGEYATTWMQECRAKTLKHTTLKRYQGLLDKHLLPTFGDDLLEEIDRAKVKGLVINMSNQGLSPKTIKNAVLGLSALFTSAIESGVVKHNPATRSGLMIKVPKRGERIEVFTHEEEMVVLETAKEKYPAYYAFILCLFRTGMREGEGVALLPEDLDLRRRYCHVQRNFTAGQLSDTPKNRKSRRVDLSGDLIPVLKEHLTVRQAEGIARGTGEPRWLFTTPQGEIIRSNNFRDRVWKPLLKTAGLSYRWVHAMRHTYATRLIMAGANLVYVQNQLGHSSIQVTVDLYCHWIELAKRTNVLEVDLLAVSPQREEASCTVGCTSDEDNPEVQRNKEEKWGE